MAEIVLSFKQLRVYQRAFEASLRIYKLTKSFPKEERFRLSNQIIKSSSSVCAGISEAWRRRRYQAAFVNKLNEAEGEAAETQHWIAYALRLGFLDPAVAKELDEEYERIIKQLVTMSNQAENWTLVTESKL